jgi:DNA-binding FadR family transcriptional regulator
MQIEPIRQRRLYRQVADQLRQLIDGGRFTQGSRLPTERELALQLGISRPTVREALIALEVDGLVDIRVGSGIYVNPAKVGAITLSGTASVPVAGPFEILDARALFEGAVAEEAAGRSMPSDIAAINATIQAMSASHHPSPQSLMIDRAFHVAIADILHNDAITRTIGDLFDQRINPYFAQLAGYFENAQSWDAATDEHCVIRDRIEARDGRGAKEAMQLHLRNSQQRFSKSFGAGPEPTSRKNGSMSKQSLPKARLARGDFSAEPSLAQETAKIKTATTRQ